MSAPPRIPSLRGSYGFLLRHRPGAVDDSGCFKRRWRGGRCCSITRRCRRRPSEECRHKCLFAGTGRKGSPGIYQVNIIIPEGAPAWAIMSSCGVLSFDGTQSSPDHRGPIAFIDADGGFNVGLVRSFISSASTCCFYVQAKKAPSGVSACTICRDRFCSSLPIVNQRSTRFFKDIGRAVIACLFLCNYL